MINFSNVSYFPFIDKHEIVIHISSYPERIFTASIIILFWYGLCCALKREWKKYKDEEDD